MKLSVGTPTNPPRVGHLALSKNPEEPTSTPRYRLRWRGIDQQSRRYLEGGVLSSLNQMHMFAKSLLDVLSRSKTELPVFWNNIFGVSKTLTTVAARKNGMWLFRMARDESACFPAEMRIRKSAEKWSALSSYPWLTAEAAKIIGQHWTTLSRYIKRWELLGDVEPNLCHNESINERWKERHHLLWRRLKCRHFQNLRLIDGLLQKDPTYGSVFYRDYGFI